MSAYTLFTARYYDAVCHDDKLPVCTSVGWPRGFSKVQIPAKIPDLTPVGLLKLGKEEYVPRYRARLASAGVDKLDGIFRDIAARHGNDQLIICCFENLTKPDNWCHRTLFAQWWTDQTGQPVTELGPPPDPQQSLFT